MPIRAHIDTGFDRRCRAELDSALADRLQVILLAMPREGKSYALRGWLRGHPVERINGVKRTDVLSARVPPSGRDAALMYRLGARISRIMAIKAAAYEHGLVRWTINAGVVLIVIDDAHELSKLQRKWLRDFVDMLLDPSDEELDGVQVGVVYLAAGLPEGRPDSPLFAHRSKGPDLDWLQFEGRLDGSRPIIWIPGLDLAETGEALDGLEDLYRPQFPALELTPYAKDLFEALLDERVDIAHTRRVRMDSIVKVVLNALKQEAAAGGDGGGMDGRLASAATTLQTRPSELEDFAFNEPDEPKLG